MAASSIEIYTDHAVVTGTCPAQSDFRDVLEAGDGLQVDEARWTALDQAGGPAAQDDLLAVDDIIAAVAEVDPQRVVHANWHPVVLEAGPYRISGALPVLPGFDPGRSITRPGGTFIQLRDARLELISRPEAGELARNYVLVNRYTVERMASDLDLGFFFPAARFTPLEDVPVT